MEAAAAHTGPEVDKSSVAWCQTGLRSLPHRLMWISPQLTSALLQRRKGLNSLMTDIKL